jgi:hypothetical protein
MRFLKNRSTDQIAREAAARRRRDADDEQRLRRELAERGDKPAVNSEAYDDDRPARDPDDDPGVHFDEWERLQHGNATITAGGGSSSSRAGHKPRMPSAADLRERRRRAQADDDLRGPRVEPISARVSAEAKAALSADDRTVGEFLEAAGRFAARPAVENRLKS